MSCTTETQSWHKSKPPRTLVGLGLCACMLAGVCLSICNVIMWCFDWAEDAQLREFKAPCRASLVKQFSSQRTIIVKAILQMLLLSWVLVAGVCWILTNTLFLQEGIGTHIENMQYVNLALRACTQRGLSYSELTRDLIDSRPVKRDSRGQRRQRSSLTSDSAAFSIPFGPHLTPVPCQQDPSAGAGGESRQDAEVTSQGTPACIAALTQCSPPYDSPDGRLGDSCQDYEEPGHSSITTNDLLDCLVHPDVMASVTRLLLQRHAGSHRNTTQS